MTAPIPRLNAALSGRYAIERELGEGGMATVYLADDERHERKVALKVLKPELAAIVGAERFLAEIKTTAGLQHPHILPLHDSGEADGFLFYVMPYVEGESLRQKLDREHQLPVDEAVRIATNVGEALDYAHRRGVIHRDIKPANILLQDGKPVVSDFGIALALGTAGGGRLTETGLSLGTPHYMSPEQATGDLSIGPATDVYALGCVLYEMLVGEPPYTGSTPQAVLGKIVTGEPRSVTEERSTVPAHVDAVTRRALEKVPADRFGTAGEMVRALGDVGFRWGEQVVAGHGGRTNPWGRQSVGLAMLTFALGAVLAFWLGRSPDPGSASAQYSSLLLPAGRAWSGRTSAPIGISDDGQRVVVRLVNEQDVGEIWVYDRFEPEPRHVPAFDGGAGSVALSPDGGWIAFNSTSDGEVQRASVVGGAPTPIGPTGLTPGAPGFTGITYGPGEEVVFSTTEGLRRLRQRGGAPEELTALEPDQPLVHMNPAFLPDGSGVVFVERDAESGREDVMILRFGEDAPVRITQGHSARVSPEGILVFGRGSPELDGSALWAGRLGSDWTALEGQPVIVADGVSAMGGSTSPRLRYALSESGTLVLMPDLTSTGTYLALADRSGRVEPLLHPSNPQFPAGITGVARGLFSPDGERLVVRALFDSDPTFRIFVWDIAREVLSPVTVEVNADWPVWTADGQRVAFNRFQGGAHNLYWARVDNRDSPEPLLPPGPYQQHAQDFSSDGRYMVYAQRDEPGGPDSDLWVHPMDRSEEAWEIVGGPALKRGAVLSPDGQWMAYMSDESGQDEVYVTDFPEGRSITKISNEAARNPVWSPVGDELYFIRIRGPALMAVPISTDPDLRPGVPAEIFERPFEVGSQSYGRNLDVRPDGQAFTMLMRDADELGVPRIEVIDNFIEFARDRLGER